MAEFPCIATPYLFSVYHISIKINAICLGRCRKAPGSVARCLDECVETDNGNSLPGIDIRFQPCCIAG